MIEMQVLDKGIVEAEVLAGVVNTGGGALKYYEGEYSVVPTFSQIKLATEGYTMRDDVTVDAIPISSVANESGGRTVIIGG